jgi:hypothetical protein
MYSWEEHLSAAPLDCKHITRALKRGGASCPPAHLLFARLEFVLAWQTAPFSNRAWERLRQRATAFRATATVDGISQLRGDMQLTPIKSFGGQN